MEHFLASNSALALNLPIIRADSTGRDFARVAKMMKGLNGCVSPLEKEANILAVFEQALLGQELTRELKLPMEQCQLKIVRDYLQSCFTEKITLDQLERCSGINKFHLIRLFKAAFKIPPHTYQTLLRINYAKKELRRNETILEVAHKAGFYDQSHFSKTFKSYTGTTPERYQKSM
jgi:AraC-like DNA-binding protein